MKRRLLLSLILAVLFLAALVPAAWAQDKVYYWDSINVDITVLENGNIRIVETQKYVFTSGSFHFAYRNIPTSRLDAITDVSVREGGQDYRPGTETAGTFTTSREGNGDLRITWYFPYTSNAARTFAIAYTVKGGLRYYSGGDQLWW